MENKVCMNCGAPNPENDVRFLVVDANSTSTTTKFNFTTTETTTVTTEKFSGADRYVVCNRCVGKKRRSKAIGRGIVGLLVSFVVSMRIFYSTETQIVMICAIIAVAMSVICFIAGLHEPTVLTARRMLRKARGTAALGKVYVPADRAVYFSRNQFEPNINVFHQKTGLKTAVGDALFLQVIAPGKGNEAVDQFLAQSPEQSGSGDGE